MVLLQCWSQSCVRFWLHSSISAEISLSMYAMIEPLDHMCHWVILTQYTYLFCTTIPMHDRLSSPRAKSLWHPHSYEPKVLRQCWSQVWVSFSHSLVSAWIDSATLSLLGSYNIVITTVQDLKSIISLSSAWVCSVHLQESSGILVLDLYSSKYTIHYYCACQ